MSHNENSQTSGPDVQCDYCGTLGSPIGCMALVTPIDADALDEAFRDEAWSKRDAPVRIAGIGRYIACSIFCMNRLVTRLVQMELSATEPTIVNWSKVDPKVSRGIDEVLNHPERAVGRARPRRIVLPPDNIPEGGAP